LGLQLLGIGIDAMADNLNIQSEQLLLKGLEVVLPE
jgi:hypothetical protein